MKLTQETKKEIDGMTFGQMWARFRFFPHSIETQGEAGMYLQEKIRERKGEMEGGQTCRAELGIARGIRK